MPRSVLPLLRRVSRSFAAFADTWRGDWHESAWYGIRAVRIRVRWNSAPSDDPLGPNEVRVCAVKGGGEYRFTAIDDPTFPRSPDLFP